MEKQLKAVETFHNAFGQENGKWPRPLEKEEYELRYKLMAEENYEYQEACEANSLVEIADALGDQLYILCGTILKHGMQHIIQDVFDEIQASIRLNQVRACVLYAKSVYYTMQLPNYM